MKVTKTIFDLKIFDQVSANYIAKHKDKENKLCAAINNFGKQLTKIYEELNDKIEDLRLDCCSVDEKTKVILKDDKGEKQFTVENTKRFNKESKEFLKQEVTVHSRIPEGVEDLIKDLTSIEKEIFSELVIPKQQEDETKYIEEDGDKEKK